MFHSFIIAVLVVPLRITYEGTVSTHRFRCETLDRRWAIQHAITAWVTLRLSRVTFFGVARKNVRCLKAQHLFYGICKSSASSVYIDNISKKNLPHRLKYVDVGFPIKYNGFLDELTGALSLSLSLPKYTKSLPVNTLLAPLVKMKQTWSSWNQS